MVVFCVIPPQQDEPRRPQSGACRNKLGNNVFNATLYKVEQTLEIFVVHTVDSGYRCSPKSSPTGYLVH